tara:strand:+ start:23 stop:679 length:657 start_codon:yes stop_codon:yes gene_type:complete
MDYLSIVYDRNLKPKTNYPSLLAKEIFRRFNFAKGNSFLEIGCGNGDLLNEFALLGLEVSGTDLLASAANDYPYLILKKNNIEKEPLPFKENIFNIVFSKSVVEHIYNPECFFNEALRVLKPGGMLITLTPDWEMQTKKFFDDWTHKTPFTKVTMQRLYSVAGFKSLKIEYFKQLPILWKSNFLLKTSNLLAPFIRERESTKLRWIRERQILGCGFKK